MRKSSTLFLFFFVVHFSQAQTISDNLTWASGTSATTASSPTFSLCDQPIEYAIFSTIGFKNVSTSGNPNLTDGIITPGYIYDPSTSIPMTITFSAQISSLRIRFVDLDGDQNEYLSNITPAYSNLTDEIGDFYDPLATADIVFSSIDNSTGWVEWNGPLTSVSFQYNRPYSGCGLVIDSMIFDCTNDSAVFVIDTDEIPNVFTPNGDGVNDLFTLKSATRNDVVTIVNRWGEIVFRSVIPCNWDGTHNNQQCSEGVYFYNIDSNEKQKTGIVSLIR